MSFSSQLLRVATRPMRVLAVVAASTFALTSCGSDSDTASTSKASPETAPSKPLRIGSDVSFPPWESFDASKKVVGVDADVVRAIGEQLGRKVEFTNVKFNSLIPSLQAGRVDAIISALGDTAERRKTASFVDYAVPYRTILVPKGNPKNVRSLQDLCGLKDVQIAGSTTLQIIKDANADCKANGKAPIELITVQTSSDLAQTVSTKRAEAWVEDVVSQEQAVKTLGADKFEILNTGDIPAPSFGLGVLKSNTALLNQLQKGFAGVIADGGLNKIAEDNGVPVKIFPTESLVNKGKG